MEKGNPDDPLLRQVLTSQEEFVSAPGYSTDPLEEQHSVVPGLLHKYRNRALLLVKGGCAVNCRYCFRRHFPYAENQGNKRNWQVALDYISAHPELDVRGKTMNWTGCSRNWKTSRILSVCVFTAVCRLLSQHVLLKD
jgi:KamA family protein